MGIWNFALDSFGRGGAARAINIDHLHALAARRVPKPVYDFISGGAEDEVSLRGNSSAFERWRIVPRYGVDVSDLSLSTSILTRNSALPLGLAPTGLAGLCWPDADKIAARAAANANLPYCLSTNSVAAIEEVAEAAPETDLWFQIYALRDRAHMRSLVGRARAAGYRTLVITVDLPVSGRRERDLHNGFTIPLKLGPKLILDVARKPGWLFRNMKSPVRFGNFEQSQTTDFSSLAQHIAKQFDPSFDWDAIARLRDEWRGPVVVKGLLDAGDARRAAEIGADGIMVSNHGGRQLDGAIASLDALPAIVEAVGKRCEVFLDGGIRRGSDIIKALALGARACFIGRPMLWGLAAGGAVGANRCLDIFRNEFATAMALAGAPSLGDVALARIRPIDEPAAHRSTRQP